jgi:hypothetical protein
MTSALALYYPYIHFRDPRWLKTAILMWDEVCRIVPDDFRLEDDPEVTELMQFVRNIDPASVTGKIATELETFLRYNIKSLQRYTVTGLPDEQLGFLYHTKIQYGVAEMLREEGLARLNRNGNPNWIGLHPSLAAVYMSAIANHLAKQNQLEPVTSDGVAFCSLGGIRECAQGLLEGEFRFPPDRPRTRPQTEVGVAPRKTRPDPFACIFAGFEIADSANVPAQKIVRFLEKHPNEKVAFRHYVHELRTTVEELAKIDDEHLRSKVVSEYLRHERNSVVGSYREQLRDAGIQTILKMIAFRAPIGAAITAFSPGLGTLATAAALAGEVQDYLVKKRQLRRSNAAAAYLLDMQNELSGIQLADKLRAIFAKNQEKAQIITLGL